MKDFLKETVEKVESITKDHDNVSVRTDFGRWGQGLKSTYIEFKITIKKTFSELTVTFKFGEKNAEKELDRIFKFVKSNA